MTLDLLTTKEIATITGWSTQKIRSLIHSKKLPAIDTSSGNRPTFMVRREDLEKMLTPAVEESLGVKTQRTRIGLGRQRIDSHVKDVFGSRGKSSKKVKAK